MKALVSTEEKALYISSYTSQGSGEDITYIPVQSELEDSYRITQVADAEFPVHPSNLWIDCGDNVNPQEYYYQPSSSTIKLIPNASIPA